MGQHKILIFLNQIKIHPLFLSFACLLAAYFCILLQHWMDWL